MALVRDDDPIEVSIYPFSDGEELGERLGIDALLFKREADRRGLRGP